MQERPIAINIFGILNIGFGVFGLVDLLMPSSFESLASASSNPMLNSVIAFLEAVYKEPTYALWRRISTPVDGAANLCLFSAGIGLLMMKNWARLTSIGYSIYKLIFALLNVAVLLHAIYGILAKEAQAAGFWIVFGIAAVGFVGFLLTAAYPVLLIIFLRRPKMLAAFSSPPPSSSSSL